MYKESTSFRDCAKLVFFAALLAVSDLCCAQDYLFGLTQYGGINNKGVPYQISTNGTGFISYTDFDGNNGEKPGNGAAFLQLHIDGFVGGFAALTESGDQQMGIGTRVNINPGQGGLIPPFRFQFSVDGTGTNPAGRFLQGYDMELYAMTSANGQYGGGALFMAPPIFGNGPRELISFDGPTTGRSPKGSLTQGPDGKLYGMTELGGAHDLGVIFSYDKSGLDVVFKKLLDFDGTSRGSNPTGNLLLATDGKLYGMTRAGGANGQGVVFSILKDGTGYTKLLDFNGSATGTSPHGSLVQFTDGKLYGMTSAGGASGNGTIFSLTLTGTFAKIHDFNGTNGKSPVGDLLIAPSGTVMYGVTYSGGINDKGVLFKLQGGNQFTKLYDYSLATGSNPVGTLAMIRQTPALKLLPIPEKTTLTAPFTPAVETSADMPVYFTSTDPSVAVIENNQIKITGAGATYIRAFQLGNHSYLPQSAVQVLVVNKVTQSITFTPISPKTFGDPSFTLSATSSSGLPVTFWTSAPDIVSINGNTATLTGAGTVRVTARQVGDQTYAEAVEVVQEFVVGRATQTINFTVSQNHSCCAYFNLTAIASSNLPVSFKTEDRDKLSIYESQALPLQVGQAEVIAYNAGNTKYKPAEARATVNILKGSQTISFTLNPTTYKMGDPPAYIFAGSSSGLPLTFTSNPPGIAVIQGGMIHILGVGTTTIVASQPGNALYNPALPFARTVTVNPSAIPPTGNIITWNDLPARTVVEPPFNLTATASSGLPVSYTSSNPSVAEISGNLVTLKGYGSTTITATQPGKDAVPAAASVSKVLEVNKDFQYINLSLGSSSNFGSEPIPLPITTTAGLPIMYTVSDENIATVENYALHLKNAGVVQITASHPGNDQYLPADPDYAILTIYPAYQYITFNPLPSKTYGDAPFDLVATSSEDLPVTFTTSDPQIATMNGSTVSIHGAGVVTITAVATAPGYYSAESAREMVINKANQTITFLPLTAKQFGDAPFVISSTSDSNLPVIFISAKPSVAKVSGSVVTITGNGMADIVATQPGNENYAPAESVHQQFLVADAGNTYNLAGSAWSGGPQGSGALFTMDSEGAGFNLFKQFAVRTLPFPQGGFIKGTDGRMYGNFYGGGVYNSGRIVKLEADGTGLTVLHEYNPSTGTTPFGNLIQANNGDLYGMTRTGGTGSGGTIFRIKTDGTGFTVLYHFTPFSGNVPLGGLLQANNGKLYGITQNAGFFGPGTIFSINMDGSDFTVIYNLNDLDPVKSGLNARGDLVQGPDNFLYGTLMQGGVNNKGTLFKIMPDGSGFAKLIDFDGTTRGAAPASTLLFGSDGKIYGLTQQGGASDLGTLYAINADGTNYTRLLDFDGATKGANPAGKLAEGTDGFLYGMTNRGGINSMGTVFRINKNGSGFHKMADLSNTASLPVFGPLLESTPGNFFGMTSGGGPANGGTIFKITSGDVFTVLDDFPQEESGPTQLIQDPSGEYYYGVALHGGVNGSGSVFRVRATGADYERILDLPTDHVIYGMFYMSTGHLWCTGTLNGQSFIFRMKPDGTEYQPMTDFNTANPSFSRWLVEASDGYVYGTTGGGFYSSGIIFRIKNDGTGYAKVLDMPSGTEMNPGTFIQGSDGNFYVCTAYNSELYRFTGSGTLTKVFTFPEDAGEVPMKMIELNGGSLGIITRDDGSGERGSIFTIEKDGSSYAKVFDPKDADGTSPIDMLQTMDGWLYVAAQYGGSSQQGVIYKVRGDGSSFTKVREFQGTDGSGPNSISFKKEAQSFTCNELGEKKTSDPAFLPTTTTTSGAPVQFYSSNPAVAIVEHGKIKPVGVGITTITASLPANANFYKAPDVARPLVVVRGDQTITFDALAHVRISDPPFELHAVSSSGLPVTYQSSDPSVAEVTGSTLTIKGIGITTITASQGGNDNFFAAADVQQELLVSNGGIQTIQFTNPGTKILGGPPFALMATASSNLAVVFSTVSDKVSLDGATVTMLKSGEVTVMANQGGDINYLAASPVQVSFCINPLQPTIMESGTAPNIVLHSSNDTGNQWYLNGGMLSGFTSNIITVSAEGTYTVTTTIEGCASAPSAPHVFITTAMEEKSEVYITLLPNPVTDVLYVDVKGQFSGPLLLELIDGLGRRMEYRQVTDPGTTEFDLRGAPNGLYLMKVVQKRKVSVTKVLKQ